MPVHAGFQRANGVVTLSKRALIPSRQGFVEHAHEVVENGRFRVALWPILTHRDAYSAAIDPYRTSLQRSNR
jgi:hypothetical protein